MHNAKEGLRSRIPNQEAKAEKGQVKVSSRIRVTSRLSNISANADRLIDEVVVSAAGQIQEIAQTSMHGNPPSAEGEYPAVRTGLLRGTLSHTRIGRHQAITFSPMEYAPHLEYGTVKMGARPFLRPSLDRVKPSFVIAVERAAQRA
jgi:hypothetical protein